MILHAHDNKSIDDTDIIINQGLTWIHMQKPTRDKMHVIEKEYNFHELNIDDSLSKIQIPKIDKYPDHIFVILHIPVADKEKNTRFTQLSIFAGLNYLVTVHQGDLKLLVDMFEQCKKDVNFRQSFMGKSSGYLLHSIIDNLVDEMLHILKRIVGNIDDIEDAVFDDNAGVAKDISILRREITTLRRVILPLKRIIVQLTRDIQKFSEEDLTLYFDDVNDHIDKVLATLEESKETVEIFKDTDFMLSSEKTNKILSVLTIVFTLSIPTSIIGTFYGMNINLPVLENSPFEIFGYYSTFIFISIISMVIASLMIVYFKKLAWIRMR